MESVQAAEKKEEEEEKNPHPAAIQRLDMDMAWWRITTATGTQNKASVPHAFLHIVNT